VLPTIRSRTQHFDFTLLSVEEIQGHLASILEQEGVAAEPEVLALVARRAAGSDRDALSLLDQALALGAGRLDTAQVLATFGDTPFDRRVDVLEAVAADDPAAALGAVDAAMTAGVDARRLADDLLKTLRDAFVLAAGAGRVPYDGPADEVARLRALADGFGAAGLTRAIEMLGQTIVDVRGPAAPDPRLLLEVAVVRLARRESRTAIDALLERVERLERQLADGGGAAAPAASSAPRAAPKRAAAASAEPALDLTGEPSQPADDGPHIGARPPRRRETPPTEPTPEASAEQPVAPTATAVAERPLDLDAVILAWSTTLTTLSPPVRAAVQEAQPIGVDGNTIIFGVRAVRRETIAKKFTAEADAIRASLAAELGQEPRFSLKNHDFDAHDALAPLVSRAAVPGAREIPNEPDLADESDIDLRDLQDAPRDAAPLDSQTRLIEAFGAQVVEERPRA
jgi:DNA polymerase-3 subunit gamma/tau